MRWLDALQVLDSAFPTGAFAHSLGLESLTPADLGSALALRLNESVARLELVFLLHAYTVELLELDALMHASLLVREPREASSFTGTSFLRAVCELLVDPRLSSFLDEGQHHHHAVVFGAVCGALEVPPGQAAEWYALNTLRSQVSAAQRLGWIGQREAQRILHQLKPVVKDAAASAARVTLEDAGAFSPLWDIASMRHERAPARMFNS